MLLPEGSTRNYICVCENVLGLTKCEKFSVSIYSSYILFSAKLFHGIFKTISASKTRMLCWKYEKIHGNLFITIIRKDSFISHIGCQQHQQPKS